MAPTQQSFRKDFASYLAEILIAGVRDHAQRLEGILGKAHLNGLQFHAHAARSAYLRAIVRALFARGITA